MEGFLGPIATELIKLGLPGIVIIGLSIAYWLERQANARSAEARVSDAKVCWSALSENTEATKTHTEALRALADVIRAGR